MQTVVQLVKMTLSELHINTVQTRRWKTKRHESSIIQYTCEKDVQTTTAEQLLPCILITIQTKL